MKFREAIRASRWACNWIGWLWILGNPVELKIIVIINPSGGNCCDNNGCNGKGKPQKDFSIPTVHGTTPNNAVDKITQLPSKKANILARDTKQQFNDDASWNKREYVRQMMRLFALSAAKFQSARDDFQRIPLILNLGKFPCNLHLIRPCQEPLDVISLHRHQSSSTCSVCFSILISFASEVESIFLALEHFSLLLWRRF